MASSPDSISMALFCDFENVALGVRDAKYDKFDIKRVLERLLLKGSIVVKKAYCDWDRYKSFKAAMHEANFELIEIPHVRQSGKNSADIRLVVDALDLCYTKSHVDTFVIISGDSDFSPLVSKLRENAKQVIGVGVKQSTSDLLIANCDEFIFYDDLVRDSQRVAAKREARDNPPASRRPPEEDKARREELESRRSKAIDIAVETFEALLSERGESGKIWSSMLKEAIKRRKPDFNESYFGFRAFGNLLEEAQARGLLELGRDEKSGIYVNRPGPGAMVVRDDGLGDEADAAAATQVIPRATMDDVPSMVAPAAAAETTDQQPASAAEPRRGRARGRGRGARSAAEAGTSGAAVDGPQPPAAPDVAHYEVVPSAPPEETVTSAAANSVPAATDDARPEAQAADNGRGRRGARRGGERKRTAEAPAVQEPAAEAPLAGALIAADAPAGVGRPEEGGPVESTEVASAPAVKPAAKAATAKRRTAAGKGKVAPEAKALADAGAAAEAKAAPEAGAGSEARPAPAQKTGAKANSAPEVSAVSAPATAGSSEPVAGKPAARPRRTRKPKADAGE